MSISTTEAATSPAAPTVASWTRVMTTEIAAYTAIALT